jgi:hypothetical protein
MQAEGQDRALRASRWSMMISVHMLSSHKYKTSRVGLLTIQDCNKDGHDVPGEVVGGGAPVLQ